MTIPANLAANSNYYLGVIIDNAGVVSEWTEANNSSYIHIRTDDGGTDPTDPTDPIGVEDACASEGPQSISGLTSADAVCVTDGAYSNSIQYYWIYVPSGTNNISIESGHGTGNGDVYYNGSNWATSSSYTQRSTNADNTESITVTNPGSGYQYISVIGQRSDMALKVTLN